MLSSKYAYSNFRKSTSITNKTCQACTAACTYTSRRMIVHSYHDRKEEIRINANSINHPFFFSTSTKDEEKQQQQQNKNDARQDGFILTSRQKQALKLINDQQRSLEGGNADNATTSNTINTDKDIERESDISQTLNLLKQQAEIQDLEQLESNPIPWYNLLTFPSRALWRSSPNLPPPYLTNIQFDTIKKSERTSKQLRRTIENIVKNQTALSEKRERERRSMVNSGGDMGTGAKTSLQTKKVNAMQKKIKPVYYKPEHSLSSLKYRLVPNYNIMKRILREVQGLMGKDQFQPKKVLDIGIGVGSASAAVLDFALERFERDNDCGGDDSDSNRNENASRSKDLYNGVEWIHGIDPSQSMRDASERVLKGVIAGQREKLNHHTSSSTTAARQFRETRMTLGETLSSTKHRDILKSRGTFDLALCSYTLCEVPNVASSLALVAMMWEKLSPNGVAIFIEPGTPDGFNSLRSIRSMLLDCCPPTSKNGDSGENIEGDEECHVIAPCTHNGTCPMVRHKRFFFKKKRADRKKENDLSDDGLEEDGLDEDDLDEDDVDGDDMGIDDGWLEVEEEEWAVNESFKSKSTGETDIFDSSFCSFVHGMPGGEHGKRGEKFTYLVVQKRITGNQEVKENHDDPFHDTNIVELLSQSMYASGKFSQKKEPKMKGRLPHAKDNHELKDLLSEALDIEKKFINSEEDLLGLELVKGKFDSWGRIIRAPIKKKGHVIIDYCASSTSENGEDIDDHSEESEGKIIRRKIARSHSDKAAPGMYLASRKSRWGGLWPDLNKAKSTV